MNTKKLHLRLNNSRAYFSRSTGYEFPGGVRQHFQLPVGTDFLAHIFPYRKFWPSKQWFFDWWADCQSRNNIFWQSVLQPRNYYYTWPVGVVKSRKILRLLKNILPRSAYSILQVSVNPMFFPPAENTCIGIPKNYSSLLDPLCDSECVYVCMCVC